MDSIKLSGNNGSVSGSDFVSFELVIEEQGQINLEIKRGREKETHVIVEETKKVSPRNVSELLSKSNFSVNETEGFAMVGGPEKIIEIHRSGQKKISKVTEENSWANRFFVECLSLYNSGLKRRLDELIYH